MQRWIFCLCLLAVPGWAFGQTWECREVMVPMRDGVELATDVYVPENQFEGPYPVLIERTPYNKRGCEHLHARYFVKRGYVVLIQDERGRYNSEGTYYWLRDEGWGERQDGHDTIEWAAKQSWSSGKVGTMGLSFTCANQYLTMVTKPPHLEAMFCAQFATNIFKDLYWAGGALHMIMPTWLLTQNEMVQPLGQNFPAHRGYLGDGETWMRWYGRKSESERTFAQSMMSPMLDDLIGKPYYDDFWRQFAVDENWDKVDVPIYHYSGWYDRYPHAAVKHFNGINKLGGEKARGHQKLILTPHLHGASEITARVIGDIDFGPEASIDYNALRLRWFDYHLKGIDNGIMDEPPVRIFVMGDNVYRDENEFPLARTDYQDFYFRAGKSGSIDSLNDGVLSREAPTEEPPDIYEYDPRNPVPSIGGDLFVQPNGARDHRPAGKRSLTYTTSVLTSPVEVTGLPKLVFYASSSAVDTDWVVTITDVHPDGYSQTLRQNILRARYREGDEAPVFMKPGEIYPFEIEMYPISNVFLEGHRIRIVVSSSSFPKWYPNGNTGKEMDEDFPGVVAKNSIYHDREHPSKVVLPVIPRGATTN
ncbi:MAG: CocE/NonD family hydrolase [Acidobacteria bacterium]|nr:MAG: CocE/NonD family hydrolase [Acidobacteriota bacterium]